MDYFLPQLLNELISGAEAAALDIVSKLQKPRTIIAKHFTTNPEISKYLASNPSERMRREGSRFTKFALMYESLTDKYDNAYRAMNLLSAVDRNETGFVLWLRGFSLRVYDYNNNDETVGVSTNPEEYATRFDLASKLSPVPVVLLRNPAMSESLLAQFEGAKEGRENTFVIDMDAEWESNIRTLAKAASFIIMSNDIVTPGIRTEINVLKELNRIKDTYFSDPKKARSLLKGEKINTLNDAAIVDMHSTANRVAGSPASLNSPTCLWLQGNRRKNVNYGVLYILNLFSAQSGQDDWIPRDVQTVLLAFAIAGSIGLERLDLLVMSLAWYAIVVTSYQDKELPEHSAIAEKYKTVANSLIKAIEQVKNEPPIFEYIDLVRLTELMTNSEDPIQLIRKTVEIVHLIPERFRMVDHSKNKQ